MSEDDAPQPEPDLTNEWAAANEIEVKVFAPDDVQADLRIADADGAVTQTLPMALAERDQDHLVFKLDAKTLPCPMQLIIVYDGGEAPDGAVAMPLVSFPRAV